MFKTISEIDRVLKDKSYLVLIDFDTNIPYKKKYQHYDGLFSYKHDYSKFFTTSNHYSLVKKISYSHHEFSFSEKIDDRVSLSVLYKENYDDVYNLK